MYQVQWRHLVRPQATSSPHRRRLLLRFKRRRADKRRADAGRNTPERPNSCPRSPNAPSSTRAIESQRLKLIKVRLCKFQHLLPPLTCIVSIDSRNSSLAMTALLFVARRHVRQCMSPTGLTTSLRGQFDCSLRHAIAMAKRRTAQHPRIDRAGRTPLEKGWCRRAAFVEHM